MDPTFRVQIYSNIVRANVLLDDWTYYVEGLNFGTEDFGGYGACTFTLKRDLPSLLRFLNGYSDQPSFITNRIRVIDPFGAVAYEGALWTLTLRVGGETYSRSADSLFNCARVDYKVGSDTYSAYYDDASSRNTFGKKAVQIDLRGTYPAGSGTPLSVAKRQVKRRRQGGTPDQKTKGGAQSELAMEVTCVGLGTQALSSRYAVSNIATLVDSSQIPKDMLGANLIAEGAPNAARGPSGGWTEFLDTSKTLGFGQQFIHPTNFTNIRTSGTMIENNRGSGSTRLEIIKQALENGSSNDRPMLFQVWDDGSANAGKGIAHFRELSETRPFPEGNGYDGYFDVAGEPIVMNAGMSTIPLWRVRAGKFMTTVGIVPNAIYPSVYQDPRVFYIAGTNFDVDSYTLTLNSDEDFDPAVYLGRLIGGKKVIKGLV